MIEMEEVEAVLSKAAKKKAKKLRQKDRHFPLQHVEGVGQGLDQEGGSYRTS